MPRVSRNHCRAGGNASVHKDTCERILKNIKGSRVTVHCTITSQIADRQGYLDHFLGFWTSQPEVAKVWFSIFTPQRGATDPQILSASQRNTVVADLRQLPLKYQTLDMPEMVIREIVTPPRNPEECIFARTTQTLSADLQIRITPCQFGGDPDCGQCGCIASMGLAAVGHHRVVGGLTAGHLFMASDRLGKRLKSLQRKVSRKSAVYRNPSPFRIIAP